MTYTFLSATDRKVSAEQIKQYAVIVAGEEATGDADLARVFRDDLTFRRWAETSPMGDRVESVYRTREEILAQKPDAVWVEKMQRLGLERQQEVFNAFAELVGDAPGSEEVIRLAMVERTPLTPKIFDPMLLWDRRIEFEPPQGGPQDPRTSMLVVPSGWWPVLGWGGWDNRARSARVFGLNVLCENNWWGGRSCWLLGFNMLLNLDRLAFAGITSSIISF